RRTCGARMRLFMRNRSLIAALLKMISMILLANSPGGGAGAAGPRKFLFCGWCGRLCRPHHPQNKSFLEGKALQTSHLSKPAISSIRQQETQPPQGGKVRAVV